MFLRSPSGRPMLLPRSRFFLLLTISIVLYVYRFFIAGVNVSLFRLVVLGWTVTFVVDLLRGRQHLDRRYLPLAAAFVGLFIVNAIDFLLLSGYPALRRDIANHLFNLWFAGLLAIYVDNSSKLVSLVKAFVLSSIVTTAITAYSAAFDHVPFEGLIRTFASDLSRGLSYINDDTVFRRATSSFFDPNFYGIYSMLAAISACWLWLYDRPRRWIAACFAVNLFCLTLTLSRTAVIGLLAGFATFFALDRRARVFTTCAAGATLVMLYLCTALQSHAVWKYVDDQLAAMGAHSIARPTAARSDASHVSAAPGASAALSHAEARASDVGSVELRMAYIDRGLAVFRSSPIWGQGSASLLTETNHWSSAHLTYLTVLARYGVIGSLIYGTFMLYPILTVSTTAAPAGERMLVLSSLGSLLVVYLSYDVFFFFEVQYLFFGISWAVALHKIGWQSRT